jgi:hypothetical protein
MKYRFLAIAGAFAALPFASSDAFAFFDRASSGCATPHAVECYKAVQTPDLYTTRHKQVMVKPGWWETKTVPAVYGNRQKQVMVNPGQTVWHTQPAQWGTVHEQRVVQPGYQAWVRSGAHQRRDFLGDIFGHGRRGGDGCGCAPVTTSCETVCKVSVPAKVETVARQVMVAPEKRTAQHIPATYQWVNEPYLIQPARTQRHFHQAVYETVAERVLVQRGTTSYQPVAAPVVSNCGNSCGSAPAYVAPAPSCGGSTCGAAMPVYHPAPMPSAQPMAVDYDDEAPRKSKSRGYMPTK